jgi:hypothetical protein
MTLIHYADIYDLEDKKHSEPRWSDVDQRYRYYEGYGQGACSEKADFLVSINRDHELWSGEIPEPKEGRRIFTVEEHVDRMLTESDVARQVDFLTETWDGLDKGLPQGSNPTMVLDGRDRTERLSWNFSKMLCDYFEKADGMEAKAKFFKFGGVGEAWSKDSKMMASFGPLFEKMNESLKDDGYKISLSDQSVKDYPRRHFEKVREKYIDFMRVGSRMNAEAGEFHPKAFGTNPLISENKLAKVEGGKVCRVFKVEPYSPPKPWGTPPPRRPSASSKESSSILCWEMKQEMDNKIGDIDKKMDLLIKMHGPAVEAKFVSG